MLIHFKGQAGLRMCDTSPGFIGIIAFMHPSFKVMLHSDSWVIFYASIRDLIGSHQYVWNLKSCGKGSIHQIGWCKQLRRVNVRFFPLQASNLQHPVGRMILPIQHACIDWCTYTRMHFHLKECHQYMSCSNNPRITACKVWETEYFHSAYQYAAGLNSRWPARQLRCSLLDVHPLP